MPKTPRKKTSPARKPRSSTSAAQREAPIKKKPAATKSPDKKAASKTPKRPKVKKAGRTVAQAVAAALDDLKALDVHFIDVRHLTTVTDTLAIASGRSDRHVRAIADAVVEQCKKAGIVPLGVEGQQAGEWVLVDLADLVVHVMLPRVREFYNLEKLWGMPARAEDAERA